MISQVTASGAGETSGEPAKEGEPAGEEGCQAKYIFICLLPVLTAFIFATRSGVEIRS